MLGWPNRDQMRRTQFEIERRENDDFIKFDNLIHAQYARNISITGRLT